MKQILTLVCALIASSFALANATTGLNKGSAQLDALSNTWKSHGNSHANTQKDTTLVYGGDDVSRPVINVQPIIS